MKFVNLCCPQKLYKTCKILSFSQHYQTNTASIPFSNRKYKGRQKTSNERKNEKKNTAFPNINSREMLKIE